MATKVKTPAQKAAEAFRKAQQQGLGLGAAALTGPAKGVDRPLSPPAGGLVAQPEAPDPYLEYARIGAIRSTGLANADAAWDSGQLQRSSGFDANGNVVSSGADFNPFSQAMVLQDEWKKSQAGSLNSYAGQGQFNSGAYGRAQASNDRSYAQGFDALKTSALQGYHGIGRSQLGAYADGAGGVSDADFAALQRRTYGG